MTAHVLHADARALPLADGVIDLIVTSPPYWSLRAYTDEGERLAAVGNERDHDLYLQSLWEVTTECFRVLKPQGSMWINLGDRFGGTNTGGSNRAFNNRYHGTGGGKRKQELSQLKSGRGSGTGVRTGSLVGTPWRYAIGAVDRLGLCLRDEIVWDKPNAMPESVNSRVRRVHEHWFHLTRGGSGKDYYHDLDAIREPHLAQHHGHHPQGRIPGSVWRISASPSKVPVGVAAGLEHFATFPVEWPKRLVQGWCPPGGVVLDPFGGTGTTAVAASVLGRIGVSVDLSGDYGRIAAWKVSDPGQRRRVAG